jgi:hypothetical protein
MEQSEKISRLMPPTKGIYLCLIKTIAVYVGPHLKIVAVLA